MDSDSIFLASDKCVSFFKIREVLQLAFFVSLEVITVDGSSTHLSSSIEEDWNKCWEQGTEFIGFSISKVIN